VNNPIITSEVIEPLRAQLEDHPVYEAVDSVEALRCFMEHHVYSVWDFMSLVKSVQAAVAPAKAPWTPRGDGVVRRFINEVVLEEESDEGLADAAGNKTCLSHFELYCVAMQEISADHATPRRFVEAVDRDGLRPALERVPIPAAAREFTRSTFGFIDSGKPHIVAAALALGREYVIPGMFRALLNRMGVAREEVPHFVYYMERHIHLDEDSHAPMAMRLLNELCGQNTKRIDEAVVAARAAVRARLSFWDGVLAALSRKAA
jgi:hypothetical protein